MEKLFPFYPMTEDSIARAKAKQLQERLAAGVDLLTGRPARLTIICAWCSITMQLGDTGQPPSHGVCDRCAEHLRENPNRPITGGK